MAGDPFEDAFVSQLDTVMLAAAIPWTRKDVQNTPTQPGPPAADAPAASAGWFEIDFLGGDEAQYTSGAPSNNLHLETGQVTISAVTKLRPAVAVRDLAGAYLDRIRTGFRGARFPLNASHNIRIIGTVPMGSGQDEAGNWVRSLGLRYEVFRVG